MGTSAEQALASWRGIGADVVAGLPREPDVVRARLLHPTLTRLSGDVGGAAVLDVGCGTGELSLALAASGATVTALDPSAALTDLVRARAAERGVPIEVVQGALPPDGRWPPDLAKRVVGRFDVTIASLVLCVIPDLEAAVAASLATVRPGGRFVLAVEHPCFEQNCRDWTRTGIVEVTSYLSGYEIPGRIAPDYHRPLSAYLNALLRAGWELIEVSEPGLDAATVQEHPGLRPLREIPLFLAVSARAPARPST